MANAAVDTTLAQFRAMERKATSSELGNWRFQQALYRAYYDAYIRNRLIAETAAEERAIDRLRTAKVGETEQAMRDAESILDAAVAPSVALDLRQRVFDLGEDLYKSIRMQQSVKLYKAIGVDRGASLDTIDYPLNNRAWLRHRFAAIRKNSDEAARLAALREIVEWTNPGPGGVYDDLGNMRGSRTWFSASPLSATRRRWFRHVRALRARKRRWGPTPTSRDRGAPVGSIMPNRCLMRS